MPFLNDSTNTKNARGQVAENSRWTFEQAKKAWEQAQAQFNEGNAFNKPYTDYLGQQMRDGIGTPQDIRDLGKQVMPGVDPAIATRQSLLEDTKRQLGYVPKADTVSSGVNEKRRNWSSDMVRNSDLNFGALEQGYGGMVDKANAGNLDIMGNISQSFDDANALNRDTHGGMIDATGNTYGGLESGATGTFDNVDANIERLSPLGDFAAARSARAFAPQMRNTMERLRRSGINPNSVEAQSLLRSVEGQRGRAMDDAMASGMTNYVNAQNASALARQNAAERLGIGKLDTANNLITQGLNNDLGLRLDQGQVRRDEMDKNRTIGMGLDSGRMSDTINLNNFNYGEGKEFHNTAAQDILDNRTMHGQDFTAGAQMNDALANEELVGLDLKNQQFNSGMDFKGNDLSQKNWAASGMGNAAQNAYSNSGMFGSQGLQASDLSTRQSGQSFSMEPQPWGPQVLGAAAGIATNMFAPGLNSVLSRIPGTQPVFGQQGQRQSARTAPWNPRNANGVPQSPTTFQNPFSRPRP